MPHQDDNMDIQGMSKNDLKKAIQDLQKQKLKVQEERGRLEKENEVLKRRINAQEAPTTESDVESSTLNESETRFWKKEARGAGGRAAALFEPFLNYKVLADHRVQTRIEVILSDVRRAKDKDEDLEESHNPELYWDELHFESPGPVTISREMIFHLSKSPGKLWLEEWFQHEIRSGIRKLRSLYVYDLARCYSKIFGFTNSTFTKTRSQRPNMPEVQALSDFMNMQAVDEDGDPDLTMFFKHECILRALRLLLLGESAIEGERSSKARDSHVKLWHLTDVTPSLLAFVATAIKFVLSGEAYFELGVGPINWSDYFHARLRLLERFYDNQPELFAELLDYYNDGIFPNRYNGGTAEDANAGVGNQAEVGMSGAEQAFFEQLED